MKQKEIKEKYQTLSILWYSNVLICHLGKVFFTYINQTFISKRRTIKSNVKCDVHRIPLKYVPAALNINTNHMKPGC